MKEKTKMILGAATVAALICSCTSERYETTASPEKGLRQLSANAISVDEALKSLNGFMRGGLPGSTRSDVPEKTIATIKLIRLSDLMTKSDAGAPSDVDGLVYLVNFEGGEGYAMLAADDRIKEDVLIVTEKGSLSERELIPAFMGDMGREDFSDYPRTGPGIITGEDGEKYINPNTFQIYDEDEGDYNVGDLNIGNEPEGDNFDHVKVVLATRALNYSIEQVSGPRTDDSVPLISGAPDPEIVVETERRDRGVDVVVNKLLDSLKFWHQRAPFNQYSPMVREELFSSKEKKGYAGCVPLAIAKIIAYHRFPDIVTYNGVTINWDDLSDSTGTGRHAARLIRWIGESSNSIYTSGFTGTFPSRSARCMRDEFHYSGVEYGNYDTYKVTKTLKNGCPLFVCSVPRKGFLNYDLKAAHGWNIDGYKLHRYDLIKRYYKNQELIKTVKESESIVHVHCDFGWKDGLNNGYFTSGIFDLSVKQEWDGARDSTLNSNYNWYLKTITYDHPPIKE